MTTLVESHRGLGQIEFEGQRLPVRYLYLVSSADDIEAGDCSATDLSPTALAESSTDVSGAMWLLGDGNLASMREGVLREKDGRALSIQVRSCSHLGGTASYKVMGEVSA